MNAKKLLVTLFVLATYAGYSQVSIGLQGGGVLSNPSIKSTQLFDVDLNTKSRSNWQAGLVFDIPLGENGWRFMPELNYNNKGYDIDMTIEELGQSFQVEGNSNISYLELPFNMVYAVDMGDNKLLIGAGPYLAYGINGKDNIKLKVNGTEIDRETGSVEFGTTPGTVQRFDYGLNGSVGYLLNGGLLLKANYSFGLGNVSNEGNESSYKNRYFGLSLAYFFKRAGA
jgi:hypothetical protein